MAIPTWLYGDGSPDDRPPADDALDPSALTDATDVFEVLSDPTRASILAVLHGRSAPMSYTALREAAGVEDKGRFNYHLRRLDRLVRTADGAYALTARGERVVGSLLADGALLDAENSRSPRV
ncbi:winged helix-turn-helix domain-containing protein [Haloplanus halophilus]|uniref:winged helix-turn-helix domain-containing protein n=1 Tax=Haloplanus halophilus TaxID=2949993 RepID=UPI00203C005B|nr:helix-turn-helix domain-containing protein [Haloplanus sp. GDY1]